MRIAGYLGQGPTAALAASAITAVEARLDRVWLSELAHDPFLPIPLVARDHPGLATGTAVSIAFSRSPWATAQAGWDLARLTGGTFALGLGTQVRSHIQRRIGGIWQTPVPYLREYIGAVRAIWAHWQSGGSLEFTGEYFNLDLSAPLFHSEPDGTPPPIYVGGVNSAICRMAGRVADGFIAHGFNSRAYLRERVLPELLRDRDRSSIDIVVPVLVGASDDPAKREKERERVRGQVAFYASTPAYATILAAEGLEELGVRLGELAKQQRWAEMTASIDDDVLERYAITGTPFDVGGELVRRYGGSADELLLMQEIYHGDPASWWSEIRRGMDAALAEGSAIQKGEVHGSIHR
jgi:probable F420-dependent oxidoreductase